MTGGAGPADCARRVGTIFEPGGDLEGIIEDFRPRPPQVQMAEAVAAALSDQEHLLVEAATGTGKTLAYLVPALLAGRRVVVSTGTRNLQDQLFEKDIPRLCSLVSPAPAVAVLKGRANYLCLLRWERLCGEESPPTLFDAGARAAIERWLTRTDTGERGELSEIPARHPVWELVGAGGDRCGAHRCLRFADCFFFAARKRAASADLAVVNHHLLLADAANRDEEREGLLGEFYAAVIDEAHLLEEAATEQFGAAFTAPGLADLVRDTESIILEGGTGREEVHALLSPLRLHGPPLFELLRRAGTERLTAGTATTKEVHRLGRELERDLDGLRTRAAAPALLSEEGEPLLERMDRMRSDLSFILNGEDPAFVYWCGLRGGHGQLRASPLVVADELKRRLFDVVPAVILTSATLTAGGSFDFARRSLGVERARELHLPSPFPLEEMTALYLPGGLPPPDDPAFPEAAAVEIEEILRRTEGRAFVLCTSFRNVKIFAAHLRDVLPFTVHAQGERPRRALLEAFSRDRHSVLVGTYSFWQGVDVRGESLSCVIIDRLPFASPGDPVVEGRIEWIKGRGRSAFRDYQLPRAILLLRQGLGRLIRSTEDRGLLSILDNRLTSRSYGSSFFKSIPPARRLERREEIEDFFREDSAP